MRLNDVLDAEASPGVVQFKKANDPFTISVKFPVASLVTVAPIAMAMRI